MIKKIFLAILVFFNFIVQAQIPDRPSPPRLVNDFAKMLSIDEIATLEKKTERL